MQSLLNNAIFIAIAIHVNFVGAQQPATDSPQTVYRSYATATQASDWPALYSTFSPGYRDYRLFECVFSLGMDTNAKARKIMDNYVKLKDQEPTESEFKKRPDVYERHRLVSQAIVKKREMFLVCMAHFEQLNKGDATKGPKFGALRELNVDGNVASGVASVTSTVVSYSRSSADAKEVRNENEVTVDRQMYFVKMDGRWLVATAKEWKTGNERGQQVDGKRLFERMKSLEGQWRISQPARKTEVSFELIANGSVLVEKWRMSATRTSMTVYSLDGDRLLVTHYCPQGNVPRLIYTASGEDGVHRFEFLDGLNLQDKKGSHQHSFWMRFNSEDSFTRSETYIKNGEKFNASQHPDEPQTFDRIK